MTLDVLSYRHWAVSRDFFQRFGMLAWRLLLDGKSIDHLIRRYTDDDLTTRYHQLLAPSIDMVQARREDGLWMAPTSRTAQNVALIPVLGTLTKRGDLCSYGMRDYMHMIDRANRKDNVAGIVLDIDSPGGTVDGTNEFGDVVKNSRKPVVTFGDSTVASAAYWIASQSREIVANGKNPTEFGSIGVLYVHENWQAYIAKEIGSVEIIRAPQSQDKALINPIEEITDEQRAEIRLELKEIAKEFFAIVKKGRGARLNTEEENIFTGKMYKSKDALAMGMIDKIGSLQDAIDRAGDLAQGTTGSKPTAHTMTKFKSNLLSRIFGKPEEAAEEQPTAEQASMEAADEHVANLETENATLREQNEQLTADLASRDAQITALNTTVASNQSRITELEEQLAAQPTGQATTVIPGKDEETQATDPKEVKKTYATSVDQQVAEIRKQQQLVIQ